MRSDIQIALAPIVSSVASLSVWTRNNVFSRVYRISDYETIGSLMKTIFSRLGETTTKTAKAPHSSAIGEWIDSLSVANNTRSTVLSCCAPLFPSACVCFLLHYCSLMLEIQGCYPQMEPFVKQIEGKQTLHTRRSWAGEEYTVLNLFVVQSADEKLSRDV